MIPRYHLIHRHEPGECRAAFAAWRGFASPLRTEPTVASCRQGGHEVFWTVDARTEQEALALLPPFVADRTRAVEVAEVEIP